MMIIANTSSYLFSQSDTGIPKRNIKRYILQEALLFKGLRAGFIKPSLVKLLVVMMLTVRHCCSVI